MTDAFDALRRPDAPIAPDPAFARRLRRQLGDALAPLLAPAVPTSTRPERNVSMSITPYIIVRDAAAALDFYRDAFGAVELQRLVGDDGRIGHAEMTIGGAIVMLADEYPEVDALGPQTRGGPTCTFMLYVGEPAAVDSTFAQAVRLGATALREPADQFHGNRHATVADPFGHRWTLTAPVEDLSTAEYSARAAEDRGHGSFTLETPDTGGDADTDGGDHQVKHHDTGDLYYFSLPTPDVARAQRFYGAVLGWRFAGPEQGHIENISAPPGSVGGMPGDTGARLWFVVDDIEAAVRRVRDAGGTASDPVLYDSGWSADCIDDQGTTFSLSVPVAAYTR